MGTPQLGGLTFALLGVADAASIGCLPRRIRSAATDLCQRRQRAESRAGNDQRCAGIAVDTADQLEFDVKGLCIMEADSALTREQIRDILRRQREGFEQVQHLRWQALRDYDHRANVSSIEGLLDLGYRHGSREHTADGMVRWYRMLIAKTLQPR
jgi:hypothetical protein